jgi:uncharacterized protein (TIGR00661 family)
VQGKKILWGVCGIGLGHTNRQLPLIEHLCRSNKIVILAYGESLNAYLKLFTANTNVTVLPVVVPFMVGSATGLDFAASAKLAANKALDLHTNLETLGQVQELIGVPDLVISDYEPVSAQYAYATGAPLVTINQQSKYLIGDFTEVIDGLSCLDEAARLHLFFPYATARIAVSFFGVEKKAKGDDYQSPVQLYAPLIKDEIRRLKARIDQSQSAATARPSLLVYLSSNRELDQPLEEILGELAKVTEADFDIFLPSAVSELKAPANVRLHKSGAESFLAALASASGIISTAGHSLLCHGTAGLRASHERADHRAPWFRHEAKVCERNRSQAVPCRAPRLPPGHCQRQQSASARQQPRVFDSLSGRELSELIPARAKVIHTSGGDASRSKRSRTSPP